MSADKAAERKEFDPALEADNISCALQVALWPDDPKGIADRGTLEHCIMQIFKAGRSSLESEASSCTKEANLALHERLEEITTRRDKWQARAEAESENARLREALKGMLELEKHTHRLPDSINQNWLHGIVDDACAALKGGTRSTEAESENARLRELLNERG